jgi:superfamily I DNA/RNA helicase
MFITESDIEFAEKIFLPVGSKFDEERLDILRCMDSCDVVACPGSGKTTVLLSKLAIIERYLPLQKNKGICVLTHTNVAIDEIKERLGGSESKLFSYPNFFGTIQSFVNKFLAIPYYENQFKCKVRSIDDMKYNVDIIRAYYKLPRKTRFGFENKYKGQHDLLGKITELRFDLVDNRIVDGIAGKKIYKSVTETENALSEMRTSVMKAGILCYDDAYWLAHKFIEQNEEAVKKLISKRFAFVFIDEMQDTAHHQASIIDKVFNSNEVVMQRFGDPNQAIYDSGDLLGSSWNLNSKVLPINKSMRFSNTIVRTIRPLELYPTNMTGNNEVEENSSIIISFSNGNVRQVLPKFAEIINQKIRDSKGKTFKAIGRVGKMKEGDVLTLPDYYPAYCNKKGSMKKHMRFSRTVCKKVIDPEDQCDVKPYKRSIVEAILKVLWCLKITKEDDRQYSETSFLKALLDFDKGRYDDFLHRLLGWCIALKNDEVITKEFQEYIVDLVVEMFGEQDLSRLEKYFEDGISEVSGENPNKATENTFLSEFENGNKIAIHVSTIHGVKGETHTATLYCETFYYNNDVEQIIEYLKGSMKKKSGKRLPETCKLAYVGMSRPTNLLCLAARKEMIDIHKQQLINNGWEIVEI